MHFTVGNEVDFVLEKKNEGLVEHVRTLLKEGYTGRMFYYKGIVGLLTRLNRRDLQVIRGLYEIKPGSNMVYLVTIVYENVESSVV